MADHVSSRDNTLPLGIFLVKSGSKGNRLLFRYPYERNGSNRVQFASSTNPDSSNEELHEKNPYMNWNAEDFTNTTKRVKDLGNSQGDTNRSIRNGQKKKANFADPYVATVVSLPDKVLSDLFAVKPELCGQKFEVKINDIRFVGHPISLASSTNQITDKQSKERNVKELVAEKPCKDRMKDLLTFNIVVAVRANASHDIVNCYHECVQRVALALNCEEKRVGYLTTETNTILSAHYEDEDGEEVPAFDEILRLSLLASHLKLVYDELSFKGTVHLSINNWVNVSFCLPQKVHRLTLRHHEAVPLIGPQHIQKCFDHLRPYHGVLLLATYNVLKEFLPHDASPGFFRVMNVITPTKNLLEISGDSDVSLQQVFHVVAQLVYWGKATIIYPLCESNIYTVHPLATSSVSAKLVQEFNDEFNENLLQLLSEFSLGVTLGHLKSPTCLKGTLVNQIVWMLRNRLLLQMHHYVYFVPSNNRPPFVNLAPTGPRPTSCEPSSSLVEDNEMSLKSLASPSGGFAFDSKNEESSSSSKLAIDESISTLLTSLNLTNSECDNILRITASRNIDDLKLFVRLCPYFNGRRHLEDIMFYENVRRSQLLALIDKFREVLLTCQYEDTAVAQLCPYEQLA